MIDEERERENSQEGEILREGEIGRTETCPAMRGGRRGGALEIDGGSGGKRPVGFRGAGAIGEEK